MKLYLLCYGIHMRTQFTQRDSFVLPHHSGAIQLSQSLVGICLQRRGSLSVTGTLIVISLDTKRNLKRQIGFAGSM